jgi:competence protein ComEC
MSFMFSWRFTVSVFALYAGSVIAGSVVEAQTPSKSFRIYAIDAEGGLATLFVTPTGESLLMDTGSAGGRDSGRILNTLKDAGVTRLDYLVLTHYDPDHVGGLRELADKVTIRNFIDHGPSSPEGYPAALRDFYPALFAKGNHMVAKPGDKIPLHGVDALVVASAREVLQKPLSGAGKPNPYCAEFQPHEEPGDENAYSIGIVFTYGKFRSINLGDLLWNNEKPLMCPNNPIGHVDLYQTSHHGLDRSGSTALVHALSPIVAIMNDGLNKGGTPQTYNTLYTSPGFQDVWPLHWGSAGGSEWNPAGRFIANLETPESVSNFLLHPPPPQNVGGGGGRGASGAGGAGGGRGASGRGGGAAPHVPAYGIDVTVEPDGKFTVLNTRNQFSKTYQGYGGNAKK